MLIIAGSSTPLTTLIAFSHQKVTRAEAVIPGT